MSDSEIHHLGAAYALDALDEHERRAFEAHFTTCAICREDVRDFRAAAAELTSVTATPPPSRVKANVMAEIATTRQLSPLPDGVVRLADRRRSRAASLALVAAAAVVMFVAGALVARSFGGDDFGDQVAAIVAEPDARTVRLEGPGAGTVTVVWAGDRAAVVGEGLAPAGSGRAYELWAIDAAGARPLRLLDVAAGGRLRRVVDVTGTPTAFGVTIEPVGGSSTPTPPILYAGET